MSTSLSTLRMKWVIGLLSTLTLFLTFTGVNAQLDVPLAFNNTVWQYDADHHVYWQVGVVYVSNPSTTDYESLGIYVPGDYLNATDNGDGTYTATLNPEQIVNGYTSLTAPIVLPVNTPGYTGAMAPTTYNYDSVASYMQAGFIYVQPGLRGRENGYDASGNLLYSGGAPWGVTDLKAAVRYVRYNANVLPGATDRIFVFGTSGGGAQSSVMAASGDSELYTPYLESIGAAMVDANGVAISDAVLGVMAWVPITSLDTADAAYEWNMGQYVSTDTRSAETWTSALSADLAESYALFINQLGLTDANGQPLTLEASETGIYTAGSYYDYLVGVVEESLNNFLSDVEFPYTFTPRKDFSRGMRNGSGGALPPLPPAGQPHTEGNPAGGDSADEAESVTYATVEEYIASLNAEVEWVTYDPTTNTANITNLADFVNYGNKLPRKSVGAFDDLNRNQAENDVFGNDTNDSLHYSANIAELLVANQDRYAAYADWNASYLEDYASDLTALDGLGNSIAYRQNMYNPMYFILPVYEGYETTTVAPFWRIRTGIEQGDTASTVEVNLALALENLDAVQSVDFATVWDQGHTSAERIGSSTDNFIGWVNEVVGQ